MAPLNKQLSFLSQRSILGALWSIQRTSDTQTRFSLPVVYLFFLWAGEELPCPRSGGIQVRGLLAEQNAEKLLPPLRTTSGAVNPLAFPGRILLPGFSANTPPQSLKRWSKHQLCIPKRLRCTRTKETAIECWNGEESQETQKIGKRNFWRCKTPRSCKTGNNPAECSLQPTHEVSINNNWIESARNADGETEVCHNRFSKSHL